MNPNPNDINNTNNTNNNISNNKKRSSLTSNRLHKRRTSGHKRKGSKSALIVQNLEDGNVDVHEAFQQIKHVKQNSSLFNLKSFPTDETYDLFRGVVDSDDDGIDANGRVNKPQLLDRDSLSNLTNMIGFGNGNTINIGAQTPAEEQECLIM